MNKMSTFLNDLTQTAHAITEYIQRNKTVILLLSLFTFLIHGSKLYSISLGIDTEKVLDDPEDIYNSWHSIGRYGLTAIKQVLRQADFNPYFAAILTILLLILAMVAFGFLFVYVMPTNSQKTPIQSRQEALGLFSFGATVIAHPIMTEQLYFSLQGVEVTLSFLLCAISLLFAHEWCLKKGFLRYISAVIFLPLIFSVYQSFVPLYIFGAIALCCLCLPFLNPVTASCPPEVTTKVSSETTSKVSLCSFTSDYSTPAILKIYLSYIGQHIIVFASGLLINQLITNRFFGQSSYLTKQIYWDKNNMSEGFRRILSHIASVCLGYGDFYSSTFFLIAFLLFILWIMTAIKPHFGKQSSCPKQDSHHTDISPKTSTPQILTVQNVLNLLLLLALYLTPFYLTIFLGEHPVFRAQLVLPFTTGFMLYLSCTLIYGYKNRRKEKHPKTASLPEKTLKFAFVTISFLCIFSEADITSRMYYTDALRFEQDLNLAESIARDISEATAESDYTGTIVFIGKKPVTYNSSYVKGDVMGQSFFAWDTDVEPVNCWSSHRIVGFMNCMGSHFQAPTQEEATNATTLAATMTCYPLEGSIVIKDGLVIVKLSD